MTTYGTGTYGVGTYGAGGFSRGLTTADPSADLLVELASGTALKFKTTKLVRSAAPTQLPRALTTGDLDYSTTEPESGLTWDVLRDLSGGCGGFLATDRGNTYAIAQNLDCSRGFPMPGPRIVADYTGIPSTVVVRGTFRYGTSDFVFTDDAVNSVYRRKSGETTWSRVGGNFAGTLGWSGLSTLAPVCGAALGGNIAIGFGVGNAYVFSDAPDHATNMNWTASTKASNQKYMDQVLVDARGGTTPQAIHYVQSGTGAEGFTETSLANSGTDAALAVIGDPTNDEVNSITIAADGVMFVGKRRKLYAVSTAGNVTNATGLEYQYRAASDDGVSGHTTRNFRNPVTLSNQFTFWPVEDYGILYRDPSTGNFGRVDLRLYGPDIPLMQLPLLAMVGVGDELWIAVGTKGSSLIDVSKAPGGAQLLANTITAGSSYLFKGRFTVPGDLSSWVWHGSLAEVGFMVSLMWYAADLNRLFVCNAEDGTVAQKSLYVGLGNPLTSKLDGSHVVLTEQDCILETGLYTANRPNVIKSARWVQARTAGISASAPGDPQLKIKYRTAEDSDTSTGYVTLATYITDTLARTGTMFPTTASYTASSLQSPNFRGIRLQLYIDNDADASEYDPLLLYGCTLTYLDYTEPPVRIVAEVAVSQASVSKAGEARADSTIGVIQALEELRRAKDPVTVTDCGTGEQWTMRPEPTYPQIQGTGRQRAAVLAFREVV